MARSWKWQVTGYASNRHRLYPKVKLGDILLGTVHADDAGKDLEVDCWKSRMARSNDVAYVTVVNKLTGASETIYPKAEKKK